MKDNLLNRREAELLSILINGEKYGRAIRGDYEKRTGVHMPLGSLYTTLDRMEDAGLIKSRMGESMNERGGNRRKFYRITAGGMSSLTRSSAFFAAAIAGRTIG